MSCQKKTFTMPARKDFLCNRTFYLCIKLNNQNIPFPICQLQCFGQPGMHYFDLHKTQSISNGCMMWKVYDLIDNKLLKYLPNTLHYFIKGLIFFMIYKFSYEIIFIAIIVGNYTFYNIMSYWLVKGIFYKKYIMKVTCNVCIMCN